MPQDKIQAAISLMPEAMKERMSEQIAAAQGYIRDGVDYLLISAANASGWDNVLKSAKTAGVKVFLFDRLIDTDASNFQAALVSDMATEGNTAMNWVLAQNLGTVNLILIRGQLGSAAELGRSAAVLKAKADGKINLVADGTGGDSWSLEEARKVVEAAIAAKKDFNVIYAENDGMPRAPFRLSTLPALPMERTERSKSSNSTLTASLPQFELVSKMMGKALEDVENLKKGETGTLDGGVPVLEASGLSSDAGVKPFDFAIRKGEINGFTGLLGSGRSESVRAIYAADKVTGGEIKINGKKAKIDEPIDAMRQGIGYLPEDRKGDGIIADLSVRDNIILAMQVMKGFFRPFSRKQAEAFADEYVKRLSIKTASVNTPVKQLSGGNQQKVILGRWLLTHPKYLILDEPTRGIDVGTKVEIQKLMLKLAEEGVSVTFISSEIEEMLRTCSRLIVMKDRQIAGELTGANLTQKDVMHVIAGGHE